MDAILAYLLDNLQYYVIVCVALFFWDLMDLYVELRNFRFISNHTFGAYYWTRVFFCLAIMEIGFSIGLFSLQSKVVMSFVVPLSFSAILQNLVVKVGGVERSINLSEVFDKFKFRIKEALIRQNIIDKVVGQRQLLDSMKVSTDTIRETCRFYAKDEQDFMKLMKRVKQLDEVYQRLELIIWLVDQAGTVDIASELIKEAEKKKKNTK